MRSSRYGIHTGKVSTYPGQLAKPSPRASGRKSPGLAVRIRQARASPSRARCASSLRPDRIALAAMDTSIRDRDSSKAPLAPLTNTASGSCSRIRAVGRHACPLQALEADHALRSRTRTAAACPRPVPVAANPMRPARACPRRLALSRIVHGPQAPFIAILSTPGHRVARAGGAQSRFHPLPATPASPSALAAVMTAGEAPLPQADLPAFNAEALSSFSYHCP